MRGGESIVGWTTVLTTAFGLWMGCSKRIKALAYLTYNEVFHDVVIVCLLISASKGRRHGSESSQGKEADQCPFCPS